MTKIISQDSRKNFLLLALFISLGFNVYVFLTSKNSSREVLAFAGGESFRRMDLSAETQKKLSSLDGISHLVLKQATETWAGNVVLHQEAHARGKTIEELLDQEVFQKVQVSPGEVSRRLAQSPAADGLPYPQVLKEIENDLRNERAQSVKKSFIESFYPKYQVRFKIQSVPEASASGTQFPSQFPVYEPRASGAVLISKGPPDAPVLIEIYSDFMCPFSARLSGTVKEVEKQYPGKIRTVYHQFPLPTHEGAHRMSEASLCAEDQGKFWEFHDHLMEHQQGKKEKTELAQIAQELGLDQSKFQTCLESGKNVALVDQDIALGVSLGVPGTPGFAINGRTGFGAVPLEMLKSLVEWCLEPQGPYPANQKPVPSAPDVGDGNNLDPAKAYTLSPEWLEKSPSQGPKDAPITIVEFLDYHCPFCQRGSATVQDLLARHKGQIRLISKQFPLPMHPNAMKAAVASLCADEQGKFWEYQKELFGASWGKQSVEDLKAAAKAVGLNKNNFNACLDGEKTKDRVNEDLQMGGSLGIEGTPVFFINGSPLVGAQPAENFEKIIQTKIETAPGRSDVSQS